MKKSLPVFNVVVITALFLLTFKVRGESITRPCPTFIVLENETVVASVVVTDTPYNADNTGQSDAGPSIQAAINTMIKLKGGVVFLPAGKYRIDRRLILRYGVTLVGECSTTSKTKPIKINLPPKDGDTWRIQLYRCEHGKKFRANAEWTAWSPTKTTHVTQEFGYVTFLKKKP